MSILESILVSIGVVGLWTLAVHIFPGIIGHAVRKQIDFKHESKLEGVRGTFSAGVETLRGAIDLYKTSQSELKTKQIQAVENLWASILTYRSSFEDILSLHALISSPSIQKHVESDRENNPAINFILRKFGTFETVSSRLQECSEKIAVADSVLFVSSRLWHLYESLLQLYGRLAFLLGRSLGDRIYRDWRDDESLKTLIEEFSQRGEHSGHEDLVNIEVNDIEVWLRAEFVTEAERFLSGVDFPDALQERVEALRAEASRNLEGQRASSEGA